MDQDEYERRARSILAPGRPRVVIGLDPEEDKTPDQRIGEGFSAFDPPPQFDLATDQMRDKAARMGIELGTPFDPHPDVTDRRDETLQQSNLRVAMEDKYGKQEAPFESPFDYPPLTKDIPQSDPNAPNVPMRQKTQLDIYQTKLTPQEEIGYKSWAKAQGKDPEAEERDYDLRGLYKSGIGFAEGGHGTDRYKKPNHPTFSDESQYHGVGEEYGGHWVANPDKSYSFHAGQSNLDNWGPEGLRGYFRDFEPGNKLFVPGDPGYIQPPRKRPPLVMGGEKQ